MTYQSTFQPSTTAASGDARLDGARRSVRRLIARLGEHLAMRRARHELNQLSDHELADIGLSRGAIRSAVHGRSS